MLDRELDVEIIGLFDRFCLKVPPVFVKLAAELVPETFEQVGLNVIRTAYCFARPPQIQEKLLQAVLYELAVFGEFCSVIKQASIMSCHQFFEARFVTVSEFIPKLYVLIGW
jgi:hypothetical protein